MKAHSEKLMPWLIIAGYALYILGGVLGGMVFPNLGAVQIVAWQIGNTGAICASVLAGSLLAKQEWHLPSAGFIILGIVHGIFFSSLQMDKIDVRVFVTGAIILVPAIFLINFYTVFHFWLRMLGWIACVLFIAMYCRMLLGSYRYMDWSQVSGYIVEQVTIMGWCYYFWRDMIKRRRKQESS